MKKLILMAIVCLFVAGNCFADKVEVTKYSNGSGEISGSIKHTAAQEPTYDFIDLEATNEYLWIYAIDSNYDLLCGISYDSSIIQTAQGMTDTCSIYAVITSGGVIEMLSIDHHSSLQ